MLPGAGQAMICADRVRVYTGALSARPAESVAPHAQDFSPNMALFLQFVVAKWYLVATAVALLLLLVAHERRRGVPGLSPAQVVTLVNQKDAVIVDVRDNAEFKQGHIVNSSNIPHGKLGERLAELAGYRERPVVLVCKMGHHSGEIAKSLREKGFAEVYRLQGGIMEWQSSQLPLVK
jgi:rhodanese-related sulfurtransferase